MNYAYLEKVLRGTAKGAVDHDTRKRAVEWWRDDFGCITLLILLATTLLLAEIASQCFGKRRSEVSLDSNVDGDVVLFRRTRESEGAKMERT